MLSGRFYCFLKNYRMRGNKKGNTMADESIIYNEDGSRSDENGVQISSASTLSETDKKCPNCGGTMDFDPAEGKLHCPYCDYLESIPQADDAPESAQELSFADAENKETNCNWGAEKKAVVCKSCGAETIYDALAVSSECPYCGSNQVMEAAGVNTLAPGGVVPFKITQEQAGTNFHNWIKGKFFCPKLAKESAKPDSFKGIYLPYWTFDTNTLSSYNGQYGIDRTEYYKDSNGNRCSRTVTDWYNTNGIYREFFDDELVLATNRHNSAIINGLAPFDTADNKTYKPEYVAGFAAERYTIGLKDGWDIAKNSINRKINSGVTTKIRRENSADHVRNLIIRSAYNDITYKYLMLPIWCSSFKYKEKIFQFMVNGQTGKVYGKTPISGWKVALVVGIAIVAIALLIFLFSVFGGE